MLINLVINPKCKYLMACLEGGRWKDKRIRQEFAESKLLGHMDGLAALVYLIRNLDQGNSVPHLLGIGSNDHWINPEEEKRVNKSSGANEDVWGKEIIIYYYYLYYGL